MSQVNANTGNLIAAAKNRCSCYAITNKSQIPDSRIHLIVSVAVKHCPSAFNVQSARAVILLKQDHEKLWDMGDSFVQKNMPEQAYNGFKPKIAGFRGGYGTVMWFEDQDALKALGEKNPALKDIIPEWSEHSNGMHQFFVWQALELEGFGCNLQHYNFMPNFEEAVKKQWGIPTTWKLKSQLVFGTLTDGLVRRQPRTYEPLEDRVKIYGSS